MCPKCGGKRVEGRSQCAECLEKARIRAANLRKTNPELVKQRKKKFAETHKEQLREYNRAWSEANRDKKKELIRAWREENREYLRAYRTEHAEEYREKRLKKVYGIDASEFDIMLKKQDGACAVCRKKQEKADSLHVDHDHSTGAVRGLLCGPCNRALGLLGDSPDRIRSLLQYAIEHSQLRIAR